MTAFTKAKCYASSLMPQFAECVGASIAGSALSALDSSRYVVFPGFCDVHVHFREPGFSYKETIATGSRASARGGYTAVCTMPNLNPVPDSVEALNLQLEKSGTPPASTSTPTVPSPWAKKGWFLRIWQAWLPLCRAFPTTDGVFSPRI